MTQRQIKLVENYVRSKVRTMLKEELSREHITAVNRIDYLVEKIFIKYGIDQAQMGNGELAGKRILNKISSEIGDAIIANKEIVQLIKAG